VADTYISSRPTVVAALRRSTMRRTLTVMVAAVALLTPASAAVASTEHTNASCSNGKGGNYPWTDHLYNHKGNVVRAAETCNPPVDQPPVDEPPVDQPPVDGPVEGEG
jgi:hypothetical protein